MIWLDEFELYLDDRADGQTAAAYLTELLTAKRMHAFAVVASIWPENLARLATTPDSRSAQRRELADATAINRLIKTVAW